MVYVLEHLGYGCRDSGLTFSLATQIVSVALPIQRFGSDELKQRYLAKLVDGEILGAHAISEPGGGVGRHGDGHHRDRRRRRVRPQRQEDLLHGGPVADVLTVYAKLEGE